MDADARLRAVLDEMGKEAGRLDGLPHGVWRRAMVRRAAMVLGATGVAVALVTGGSFALGLVDGSSGRLDTAPAPASNDDPPAGTQGDLVATGTTEAGRWWLTAYVDDDDNICTEFTTESSDGSGGSGGGGCGPFDPQRYPVGLSVSGGEDGLSSATGDVPRGTERVELVLESGESIEAQIFDAPDGFAHPVRFYVVVPFPADEAVEVVAFSESGDEIGRQHLMRLDEPNLETVAGPFVLERGVHDGVPFDFRGRIVHEEAETGDGRIYPCTRFMLGENEAFGGGGGCHQAVLRRPLHFTQMSFQSKPNIVAIFGAMREEVDRIVIELDSGEVLKPDLYAGYELDQRDIDGRGFGFFLDLVDGGDSGDVAGEIVAYSGAEEVLRQRLCEPDFTELGSACGR